ncbi:MAG: hypothetical protein MUE73_16495 [Planctomycetes bacterium]|nr:hypothetical protein [Planctomycetota bacterium]
MATIYLGERGVPEPLAAALAGAGFHVVRGEASTGTTAGDFSLVPAAEGVTSTLRHALGNHLTSILGYGELLLRRPDLPEDIRVRIATIVEGARSCRQLLRRAEVVP